jgi:hypothetical protein
VTEIAATRSDHANDLESSRNAPMLTDHGHIGITQNAESLQIRSRQIANKPAKPATCSSDKNSTGTTPA